MTRPDMTFTVLIVDDHEPTRLLIGRILSQELGVRVVLAGTCEQALPHLLEPHTFSPKSGNR